ncbi:MAG: COX15/CtaA family protein [Burkholderiales bacterium]|nr:COX15/CtaA family protein [Burkholderiales bacterium]
MNSIPADAALAEAEPLPQKQLQVAAWLLACCALVFAMVVVGGVTRLTHSGLSIVEWQPIVGTVPPLNEAQWQETFAKYQLTPEYRKVNHTMGLDEFKGIFWWEYFHRLLGRMIGAVFLLPLLWFWWRGHIDRPLTLKLAGIFVLGGLQGAMGWYMVKSGLVDDPRVSQYRLTAHLVIALAIYAAMLWTALGLLYPGAGAMSRQHAGLRRLSWFITATAAYMVITGGFVAGIRAGLAYNTFPLMDGHLVPPEIFMLDPWYLNFFNNMATVQFDHRLGAWLLAVLVPWFWLKTQRAPTDVRAKLAVNLLFGMLALQITLGIATLLLIVPVPLAAAHQGGAVLLLGAALFANHTLR